ncbi:hypothetical protein QFZ75_005552 [Streptomyces sp. V3I8]|nr:hypothetical protein [Streptomyces sp. V3I8]
MMNSHTSASTNANASTNASTNADTAVRGHAGAAGRGRSRAGRTPLWARVARSPWTVACVVAAVVVGPSAATASALDRANAAPPHSAPGAGAPRAGEAPRPFSGAPAAGRRAV